MIILKSKNERFASVWYKLKMNDLYVEVIV